MSTDAENDPLLAELRAIVPDVVDLFVGRQDSLPYLLRQLPRTVDPENLRVWELVGLSFNRHRRFYEAIVVFEELYQRLLEHQETTKTWIAKGMPLIWIRDFYMNLGYPALAKRFLMLTLIEDAIRGDGEIDPLTTGSYFRAVWYHGMQDTQIRRYAENAAAFARQDRLAARHPERVLQGLDKLWMTEFPVL
jgi:hypothetical protein